MQCITWGTSCSPVTVNRSSRSPSCSVKRDFTWIALTSLTFSPSRRSVISISTQIHIRSIASRVARRIVLPNALWDGEGDCDRTLWVAMLDPQPIATRKYTVVSGMPTAL